jgi:hypothetical protein
MKRSAASMLSGKKPVQAAVSLFILYIKFYLVPLKLYAMLIITGLFFLVFSLLLRNLGQQNLLRQKRQMAGHNQRHLQLLRLKTLR